MEQFFVNELKANFNLRNPRSSKPTLIYLVVSLNGKQYKFTTGLKVYPKQWDKKHQQAVIGHKLYNIDNINNSCVNNKIKEFLERFSKYKSYLCNHTDKVEEAVCLLRLYLYGNMAKNAKIDIVEHLRGEIINRCGSSTLVYLKYVNHLAKYLDYRKEHKLSVISNFKDLAKSKVFKDMQDYFSKEYQGDYTVGYVNEMLAKLSKTLLYYGINEEKQKQGFITKADIDNIYFRPLKDLSSPANKVFLTNDEVTTLYNHQCDNKTDEMVKDLFLLECTSGHRKSDIADIDKFTYERNGIFYFDVINKKTSTHQTTPVFFDIARKIIIKYKEKGLPKVSDTIYGKRIKEICRVCGIIKPCTQSHHYIGNDKPTVKTVEKYKLISSHTGRHTFGCLLALRGLNDDKIGKYTGQSPKTVDRYIKSLTPVDYEEFNKQKREHPEVIVKTIEEVDNIERTASATTISNDVDKVFQLGMQQGIQNETERRITELQQVLAYLGVEATKWVGVNDILALETLINQAERDVYEKLPKTEWHKVKYLWHSSKDNVESKRKALQDLINYCLFAGPSEQIND